MRTSKQNTLFALAMAAICVTSIGLVPDEAEAEFRMSKAQIHQLCEQYGGVSHKLGTSTGYGCANMNGWIECKDDGSCKGSRFDGGLASGRVGGDFASSVLSDPKTAVKTGEISPSRARASGS